MSVLVLLDSFRQFVQQRGGVLDFAQHPIDVWRWAFRLVKSALGNGDDLVQFAVQRGWGRLLLLRFEKQLWVGQNALAHRAFGIAPGVVECGGLTRGPVLVGEDCRHLEALLAAHSRHRHQVPHGDLRPDLAFAHLLLDCLRQRLHQR